jgi:hypothetical protein
VATFQSGRIKDDGQGSKKLFLSRKPGWPGRNILPDKPCGSFIKSIWLFQESNEVSLTMREIEGLNVDHELHVAGSDILCIFLPSGRAPNAISTYPRLGWKKRLSGLDILYLADPYQNVEEFKAIGGSWFISREGDSILPVFAEVLNRFIAKSGYRRTILYGSSMGGYAAIILGCWIDNSHAIAECPQIFLDKYPVSNGVITRFCTPDQR